VNDVLALSLNRVIPDSFGGLGGGAAISKYLRKGRKGREEEKSGQTSLLRILKVVSEKRDTTHAVGKGGGSKIYPLG